MDVNHVITLGLGTPSDIPHFLLVGLSVNDVGVVTEAAWTTEEIDVPAVGRSIVVGAVGRDIVVPAEGRSIVIRRRT